MSTALILSLVAVAISLSVVFMAAARNRKSGDDQ